MVGAVWQGPVLYQVKVKPDTRLNSQTWKKDLKTQMCFIMETLFSNGYAKKNTDVLFLHSDHCAHLEGLNYDFFTT